MSDLHLLNEDPNNKSSFILNNFEYYLWSIFFGFPWEMRIISTNEDSHHK